MLEGPVEPARLLGDERFRGSPLPPSNLTPNTNLRPRVVSGQRSSMVAGRLPLATAATSGCIVLQSASSHARTMCTSLTTPWKARSCCCLQTRMHGPKMHIPRHEHGIITSLCEAVEATGEARSELHMGCLSQSWRKDWRCPGHPLRDVTCLPHAVGVAQLGVHAARLQAC